MGSQERDRVKEAIDPISEADHATRDRRSERGSPNHDLHAGKQLADASDRDAPDISVPRIVIDEVVPKDQSVGSDETHHLSCESGLDFVGEDGGEDEAGEYHVEAIVFEVHLGRVAASNPDFGGKRLPSGGNASLKQVDPFQVLRPEAQTDESLQFTPASTTDFEKP
jgi:hypothetical protein